MINNNSVSTGLILLTPTVYGIEASDKEEKDQIVELLVNFPVMRATRRNGRSRSLHDFPGGITAGQERPPIRFVNDCD